MYSVKANSVDRVLPVPPKRQPSKTSFSRSTSTSSNSNSQQADLPSPNHNATTIGASRLPRGLDANRIRVIEQSLTSSASNREENIIKKSPVEAISASKTDSDDNSPVSNKHSPVTQPTELANDQYLSSLVDEYQASLNRRDCDKTGCYRFKLLSYRMSQTLLEKIGSIKNELKAAQKQLKAATQANSNSEQQQQQSSITQPVQSNNPDKQTIDNETSQPIKPDSVTSNMDHNNNNLLELVVEKSKRIQDLERLVEDQRRLRLQDASQVEEKAAKIKEWVANKLKELENQNKQLRDQNKKQKQAVETLHSKLALLSPMASPVKLRNRPQLDNPNGAVATSGRESLVYDSVSVNDINSRQRNQHQHNHQQHHDNSSPCDEPLYDETGGFAAEPSSHAHSQKQAPPPLPLHQVDKWELQLYNLADENISSMLSSSTSTGEQQQRWHPEGSIVSEGNSNESYHSLDTNNNNLKSSCRKSSSSFASNLRHQEHSILFLVKPVFTNIDGDTVVDGLDEMSQKQLAAPPFQSHLFGKGNIEPNRPQTPADHHSVRRKQQGSHILAMASSASELAIADRHSRLEGFSNATDTCMALTGFASPMRSRRMGAQGALNVHQGESMAILRTQSVRRLPAPDKLYEFICADLTKRGYLVKPSALKNHQRWFVLKNFHLLSYKTESDETTKSTPSMKLKLDKSCSVYPLTQSSDTSFPFKLIYPDKTLQLIADSAHVRDEWLRMLTVVINMSDMQQPQASLDSNTNSKHPNGHLDRSQHRQQPEQNGSQKTPKSHEGLLTITRHGHTKRCYAILVNHVVFFLKSLADPTPISYISVKGSKIREITDTQDYDAECFEGANDDPHERLVAQDCSLAIYPKYCLLPDPVYMTFGSQADTDKWYYHLSVASGVDQSHGTAFERSLTRLMVHGSMSAATGRSSDAPAVSNSQSTIVCQWRDKSIMQYSSKAISEPLTSLPNEFLKTEAIELFKSILLFMQVPLEPIAIDYHVSLLQNCLARFLKHPQLRNEFYAQLLKQVTCVVHRCNNTTTSGSSYHHHHHHQHHHKATGHHNHATESSNGSGYSSLTDQQRSSLDSMSSSSASGSSEGCHLITDSHHLESLSRQTDSSKSREMLLFDSGSQTVSASQQSRSAAQKHIDTNTNDFSSSLVVDVPTKSELLQAFQMMAIAVSLNLPRGRLRCWLLDYLGKFADPETDVGKYALYILKAINRTVANGPREVVPPRTEIMSILLRNPYDHSSPHSIPVNFSDGSYNLVEADGSTTVDELLCALSRDKSVRQSNYSDFYLFADDPTEQGDLHILEPQRKIFDVIGWWEQSLRRNNSGRYQNTKVIKLSCRKRLLLRTEDGETHQERLMIVHQIANEIANHRIPIKGQLSIELAAIMAQITFGDLNKISSDPKAIKNRLERIFADFICKDEESQIDEDTLGGHIMSRWRQLCGRSAQECIRIYLNCIRRIKIGDQY